MPDYITFFCDMVEAGQDMTDAPWQEFEEAAAEMLFENLTVEEAWEIH